MNRWWARSDSGSSRASSFGLCEMVHPVTLGCLDDEPELATKGAGLFRRLPVSIYRRETWLSVRADDFRLGSS